MYVKLYLHTLASIIIGVSHGDLMGILMRGVIQCKYNYKSIIKQVNYSNVIKYFEI